MEKVIYPPDLERGHRLLHFTFRAEYVIIIKLSHPISIGNKNKGEIIMNSQCEFTSQLKSVWDELREAILEWRAVLELRNPRFNLSDDEVFLSTKLAFVEEMLRLIENDTNLRQTIYNFAFQPYTPKDKQNHSNERKNVHTAERNLVAGLSRAANKLEANKLLSKELNDTIGYKVFDPAADKNNSKRKYSFTDLRFIDLLYVSKDTPRHRGDLRIYFDWFFKCGLFDERITNTRYVLNNLNEGYINLGNLLRDITNINSNIALTVAYLQFYKFEQTYRPVLFAKIADGLIKREMSINDLNFVLFSELIKLIDFLDAHVYSQSSLVFLSEDDIERIFKNDISDSVYYSGSVYGVRFVVDYACRKYNHYHRNDEFHWQDADFEEAVKFLMNVYPTEKWLTSTADWIHNELSFYKYVQADNPYFQIFRDERFVMRTRNAAAKEFFKNYISAKNPETEKLLKEYRRNCQDVNIATW